ncbi:MAG TPA: hypothetical protein VEA69_06030 [Tepidisphaeraceae bacterium]|nr:hypothetical protein [Tepidisphaeraceae bacterium]
MSVLCLQRSPGQSILIGRRDEVVYAERDGAGVLIDHRTADGTTRRHWLAVGGSVRCGPAVVILREFTTARAVRIAVDSPREVRVDRAELRRVA